MKLWYEIEEDIFSYFKWFNKAKAENIMGGIPKLSVFSINGSMLFNADDRLRLKRACQKALQEVFSQDFFKDYKFYIYINLEVRNQNSRVEKYKKVWKLLQDNWELDKFNKGPEIEHNIKEKLFYLSAARFDLENLQTALELVESNSKRNFIIASAKDDILSENVVRNVLKVAFNEKNEFQDEIDFFLLSLMLCKDSDIVFRWGDSSEEAEIALVYKSEMMKFFEELPTKKLPDSLQNF